MMRKSIQAVVVVVSLAFGIRQYFQASTAAQSFDKQDSAADPVAAAPVAPVTNDGTKITLTSGQAQNVSTQSVTSETISVRLNAIGKVGFNEEKTSLVLAPIAGQVRGLRVRVGDHVSKGDVLFMLRSRDVAAAKSEYLESQRDLDLARQTYEMTRKLYEHQTASTIQLQQAQNDLAKSNTRAARTAEQLRVLGIDTAAVTEASAADAEIPIRAAIDGTVVERHLTEGQFVQGDSTPLSTVADLSTVWVLADVFERDLPHVKNGQTADVTTLAYPNVHFPAQVAHVGDVVDSNTRTIKLRLLVDNRDGRLKPEMFASVSLLIDESRIGLAIPTKAVLSDGGHDSVFLKVGDNIFLHRDVQVSSLDDTHVRVLTGLKPGDEVVADGALLIRYEAQTPRHSEDEG